MQRIILTILILFCIKLHAQQRSYVDSIVASLKIEDTDDPEDLAIDLCKPFKTDSEKVRAIYYWITENIAYDHKLLRCGMPVLHNEDQYYNFMIVRTLRKKKGICSQYAALFSEICKYANIPSKVLEGWALSKLYYPFDLILGNETNHAWNAVRINNKWYLLDLTWASGSVNGNLTKFTKLRDDLYYLTPPEEFITHHFPECPEWQLQYPYYTMRGFVRNAKKKITHE